jgi:hypothetical protein
MKKLTLNPDSLRVESFSVPAAAEERGTVRAASSNIPTIRYADYTCGMSCVNFCQHTREVPDCGVGTDIGCI